MTTAEQEAAGINPERKEHYEAASALVAGYAEALGPVATEAAQIYLEADMEAKRRPNPDGRILYETEATTIDARNMPNQGSNLVEARVGIIAAKKAFQSSGQSKNPAILTDWVRGSADKGEGAEKDNMVVARFKLLREVIRDGKIDGQEATIPPSGRKARDNYGVADSEEYLNDEASFLAEFLGIVPHNSHIKQRLEQLHIDRASKLGIISVSTSTFKRRFGNQYIRYVNAELGFNWRKWTVQEAIEETVQTISSLQSSDENLNTKIGQELEERGEDRIFPPRDYVYDQFGSQELFLEHAGRFKLKDLSPELLLKWGVAFRRANPHVTIRRKTLLQMSPLALSPSTAGIYKYFDDFDDYNHQVNELFAQDLKAQKLHEQSQTETTERLRSTNKLFRIATEGMEGSELLRFSGIYQLAKEVTLVSDANMHDLIHIASKPTTEAIYEAADWIIANTKGTKFKDILAKAEELDVYRSIWGYRFSMLDLTLAQDRTPQIEKPSGESRLLVDDLAQIKPGRLLSREEEIQLASIVQRGRHAQNRASQGITLANDQLAISEGKRARDIFIQLNIGLVKTQVAKVMKGRREAGGMAFEDLENEGFIILSRLVERFDGNREKRFATFARETLRKELLKVIQSKASLAYVPRDIREEVSSALISNGNDPGKLDPRLRSAYQALATPVGIDPSPERHHNAIDEPASQTEMVYSPDFNGSSIILNRVKELIADGELHPKSLDVLLARLQAGAQGEGLPFKIVGELVDLNENVARKIFGKTIKALQAESSSFESLLTNRL